MLLKGLEKVSTSLSSGSTFAKSPVCALSSLSDPKEMPALDKGSL